MAAEHGTSSTNTDLPPAPDGTPRQEAVDVAVEKLKNSTLPGSTSPSPATEGHGKNGEATAGDGVSSPSPRPLFEEEPCFTLLSGSERASTANANDDKRTQSQKDKDDLEYERALEVVFAAQNAHRRKSSLVATDPNALTRMRDTGCIVHALLDEHKRKGGQASLTVLRKEDGNDEDSDGGGGYGSGVEEERALPQINSCIEEGLRGESMTGDGLGPERDRRCSVGSEGSDRSFYLTNDAVEERRRRTSSMTSHPPHLSSITEDPPNGHTSNQPDAHPKSGPRPSNPKHASSSKMLTKTQLSDMAWGVRELSQRLGSIKLHLKVRSVFILTKAFDTSLIYKTREVAEWLLSSSRDVPYTVYVEEKLRHNKKFNKEAICNATGRGEGEGCERLRFWNERMCRESPEMFDFVITLGGDGTVLYASWLFQKVVPPVLSFALGSLGFLTQYDYANFRETLTEGFRDGVRVSLRLRFEGTVMRAVRRKRIKRRAGDAEEKPDLEGNAAPVTSSLFPSSVSEDSDSEAEDSADEDRDLVDELLSDEAEDAPTHIPTTTFSILNDIIIDRGPSPTLTTLEIFTSSGSSGASGPANSYAQSGKEEDKCGGGGPGASSSRSGTTTHLTTLLGDGLCISTPTGSTAYNLAASGPLSHPSNPIILLTAICAHSLSFRPLVLPDSIVLRVGVPYDARQGAWAAFDGRERVRLGRGDYVSVRAGRWPFSNVGNEGEWEGGLKGGLGWNCRGGGKQKKFDR